MSQPITGFITLVGAPGAACEGEACLPEELTGQSDPATSNAVPPASLPDGRAEASAQ